MLLFPLKRNSTALDSRLRGNDVGRVAKTYEKCVRIPQTEQRHESQAKIMILRGFFVLDDLSLSWIEYDHC